MLSPKSVKLQQTFCRVEGSSLIGWPALRSQYPAALAGWPGLKGSGNIYVTSDPLRISLILALQSVGLNWKAIDADDHGMDSSTQLALESLVAAGIVDAKIEVIVELSGRMGSRRLVYLCHGAGYDLIDDAAGEEATHVREWADVNGMIAGRLSFTKRPLALRLSRKSIDELQLDRPKFRADFVERFAKRQEDDTEGWLHCEPEVVLLDTAQTGRTGPDDDNECVLYWDGEAHRLTKRNWELMRAIWGHEESEIQDVGEVAWNNGLTPESTVRKQVNRLNQQLEELEIPLIWRVQEGRILPEK